MMILVAVLLVFILIALSFTRVVSGGESANALEFIDIRKKYRQDDGLVGDSEWIAIINKQFGETTPPVVTIDDIPSKIPYTNVQTFPRAGKHIGQRKLGLSEVQFLSDAKPGDFVVYAGAAPNNKGKFLGELFPYLRFLLVDPNPFDIWGAQPLYLHKFASMGDSIPHVDKIVQDFNSKPDQLCIVNDIFTPELARALSSVGQKCLFLSDIRTNIYAKHSLDRGARSPDMLDITWNSAQQFNWCKILKPKLGMFKFRFPFYSDTEMLLEKCTSEPYASDFKMAKEFGIDFIADAKERRVRFFTGEVRMQAFAGQSSAETRLVSDCTAIRDWGDPNDWDARINYFNTITRTVELHPNGIVNPGLGFDHCQDCALEYIIWCKYLRSAGKEITREKVAELANQMTKFTTGRFNRGHGLMLRDFVTHEIYIKAYSKYIQTGKNLENTPFGEYLWGAQNEEYQRRRNSKYNRMGHKK